MIERITKKIPQLPEIKYVAPKIKYTPPVPARMEVISPAGFEAVTPPPEEVDRYSVLHGECGGRTKFLLGLGGYKDGFVDVAPGLLRGTDDVLGENVPGEVHRLMPSEAREFAAELNRLADQAEQNRGV